MQNIVIVGANGQDGTYLQNNMYIKRFNIIRITRQNIYQNGKLVSRFSIFSQDQVRDLVRRLQPLEIYYLAAHHNSAESKNLSNSVEEFKLSHETHAIGLINFLDAIYTQSPKTRIFNASSSLIFDGSTGPMQNERTPYTPVGFYGHTKLQGLLLCQHYRENFDVFASTGILYNHESLLRPPSFLSKKLILAAHRISLSLQDVVELGNLDSRADWGYAPDFVEAFQMILSLEKPDDFVISTGQSNSVQDFANIVFDSFGLNPEKYIIEKKEIITRKSFDRIGDFSKLNNATGWHPKISFSKMVKKLVVDYMKHKNEDR
jgi:GDPmannose 4,6-dehydratase